MFWLNQKNKSSFLVVIGIILLSIPAIFPLLKSGFFQSDDGEWMIIRFSAFHQALVDGQFPVRWLGRLNHEFGYPVANFLYPGFMYLAEVPKVLGFGFVNSIKIILGASMVGSAIFTYFWLNKIFDKWSAFLGGLFYLYTPYHLFDLYKRGSVGEVLALTVVPFIFWQVERKNFFGLSLGIGLLILSHNTLALLFLPIIFLYALFKKLFTIYYLLFTIFLGLGLSAFFWIPAVFDLQYTRFFQTQVSQWSDYFVELNLIGIASIVIMAIALFVFLKNKKKDKRTVIFLIFGLASLFMSVQVSSSLWQILPVSFVQFPFRFLSIVILSAAFLSAFIVSQLKKKQKLIITAALMILLGFSAIPYLKPTVIFDKGEGFYATNEATTTVQDEYMPKWVEVLPMERPKEKIEIINGKEVISNLKIKSNRVEFISSMKENGIIRFNTVYFPGWKAFIDGKETQISFKNDRGVMEINTSRGIHSVNFSFGETTIRLTSDVISLVSLVTLVMLILKRRYGFL